MSFYKNFLIYWTIIYLSIAFIGRFTAVHKEYFPFFRWSLYSKTPIRIEHAFITVEKIGDSVLIDHKDFRKLQGFHHIGNVDANLIVQNFYSWVKMNKNLKEHGLLTILPENSVFHLYTTTIDLSKTDYTETKSTKKVLTFDNKLVYFE